MKHLALRGALSGALILGCVTFASARIPGASDFDPDIHTSRTVVHKDGTYTATRRDANARTLRRETKLRNGTLVMRSDFMLDELGRERKGRVFDGQGNLLFISEFIYAGDKLIEERVFDSRGRPVRRLMYQMRAASVDGRSTRPVVISYQNGRQMGDLMPLDDPAVFSTTSSHAFNPGAPPPQITRSEDGSSARLSGGSVHLGLAPSAGSAGPAAAAPSAEKPRRRLRIFQRRD